MIMPDRSAVYAAISSPDTTGVARGQPMKEVSIRRNLFATKFTNLT
jgi:hypothetical protein